MRVKVGWGWVRELACVAIPVLGQTPSVTNRETGQVHGPATGFVILILHLQKWNQGAECLPQGHAGIRGGASGA